MVLLECLSNDQNQKFKMCLFGEITILTSTAVCNLPGRRQEILDLVIFGVRHSMLYHQTARSGWYEVQDGSNYET